MTFRDLARNLDATVFEQLGDEALISGRPVLGMFYAPWLQPQMGCLNTGLIEPRLALQDGDAHGIANGDLVLVLDAEYDVVSIEPDGTGITNLILRPRA